MTWLQGKALTAGVRLVHADFTVAFGALQKVEYDPTDCQDPRWVADHGRFQTALRDFERRLSHLVVVVRSPGDIALAGVLCTVCCTGPVWCMTDV